MGCDIHFHVEVKIEGVEGWQHYSTRHVNPSYKLFGCMAGVRSDEVEPITLPRGLPEDATALTKFHYERWGGDAHSASWLSSKEIAEIRIRMGKDFDESDTFGYLFGGNFSGFERYPDERDGVLDVRFVFWFDN